MALSLASIGKIIERGDAVRFRPDADGAGAGNVIVLELDILRAIESDPDGLPENSTRKVCH